MIGNMFAAWNEAPAEVSFFSAHRNWGSIFLDDDISEMVAKSLRKTFLGHKADESLFSY